MATRFYFTTQNGISVPLVTLDASWEGTNPGFRAGLSSRRQGSFFYETNFGETSTSTSYDAEVWQFVSKPLAAQTISGTVKAIMRCKESNAAADMRSQMCIRVVSGDGGTIRGTLLAHSTAALSNEWDATTLTNRKFPLGWAPPGAALSSVAAQAGDRIVVEVGYRAHNASGTQYYGYIEAGDAASTDCAENETDTLQYNPWIEFSQNLLFQEDLSRGRGGVEGLISAGSERKPLSQKSVQFGGTDEYVTMGNVLGFERTNPFSLSFWVKKPNESAAVLIGKMDDSYVGFRVYTETGIDIDLINNPVSNRLTVGTTAILDDQLWHFIVITYDGSSSASGVAIYDNGAPLVTTTGADTLSASILNTVAFTLGRAMTSASPLYFVGYLDDVAVYNKALTADEVKMLSQGYSPSVVASANLVGYWKMGDGDTHPTLTDSSSSGYNGTMTNMEAGDIGYDVPQLPIWQAGGVYSTEPSVELLTSSLDQVTVDRGMAEDLVSPLGAPSPQLGGGQYVAPYLVEMDTASTDREAVRVPEFAMSGELIPTPSAVVWYKLRVRDSLAGPPPVYREWESTSYLSAPPPPAPIGVWIERTILAVWMI